ncbi:MAG: DUF3352 domain-containing protein [Leptolyngbyaceae cyanobacterium bins.59]|nr:DUF3352 domain-containing protein [Leptolyngbyaceae cyanobacterium bins.59]
MVSALAIVPTWATFRPAIAATPQASPSVVAPLPDNTAAVITVNTSPDAWKALDQYQIVPEVVSILESFLPVSLDNLDLLPGFETVQNIPNWMGDRAAIVLLPTQGAKDVNFEESFLLLAPIKEEKGFQEFLKTFKSGMEKPPIERKYKGITILEWKNEEEQPAEAAEPAPPPPKTPAPLPPKKSPTPPSAPKKLSSSQVLQLWGLRFLTRTVAQAGAITLRPSVAVKAFQEKPKPTPPTPVTPETPPSEVAPETEPASKSSPNDIVIALLPNHVALANSAKPIEQLIEGQLNKRTRLPQNRLYQRTSSHPQYKNSLFAFYMNVAEVVRFSDLLMENSETEIPLPSKEELDRQLKTVTEEYANVDAFVWLQPEGLRTQSIAHFQKPQPDKADVFVGDGERIFAFIPAIPYFVSTSRDLRQQWQLVVEAFNETEDTKEVLRTLRNGVLQFTGLSIDRDIVSWLDREYGLFLFPTRQGFLNQVFPQARLGLAFVAQTGKRDTATITLKKLEKFVRVSANGELKIASRKIKGIPVTSWEVKEGKTVQSILAYGWVEPDTLIITTGTGPLGELLPRPYLQLSQDRTFRHAIRPFNRPNQGYFYMNMGASLSWMYSLFPFDNFPGVTEAKRVIGTIRSLSATNVRTADKEQFDSLMVMAPARKKPEKPKNSRLLELPSAVTVNSIPAPPIDRP